MATSDTSHRRLGSLCLFASGVALGVFPLIRPFGPLEAESTDAAAVAAQVAAPAWVASHLVATYGFVVLLPGLFVVYLTLAETRSARAAFNGFVLCLLGAALLAGVAALEGIGLRTLGVLQQQGKADVLAGIPLLRFGPSGVLFPVGLLLLAAGAIAFGRALVQSAAFPRWAAVSLAIGLVFFFPLLPRPIRILDGLFTAAGALGLALALARRAPAPARKTMNV